MTSDIEYVKYSANVYWELSKQKKANNNAAVRLLSCRKMYYLISINSKNSSHTPRPWPRRWCWARELPGCAKRSWGCLHRRCHLLHKAPQTPHTALAPTLGSCHYSSPIYRSKGRSLQFIDFQGLDECLSPVPLHSPRQFHSSSTHYFSRSTMFSFASISFAVFINVKCFLDSTYHRTLASV